MFLSFDYKMVKIRTFFLCWFLLITGNCFSKNIVVFSPHPDDEVLMTAGIINCAVNDGDRIKVVIVTNGDPDTKEQGPIALQESINGLAVLGLNPKDIYFLGYRAATIRDLFNKSNENVLIYLPHKENWNYTYGLPDDPDYFTTKFGEPALLTKKNLKKAIESILKEELPETIYTTRLDDLHRDHQGVHQFVVESIVSIKRQMPSYSPKLYEAIVHSVSGDDKWPARNLDVHQVVPFTCPTTLGILTPRKGSDIHHIPVPPAMLKTPLNDPTVNLKYKAIHCHTSKVNDFHYSFVKSDEIFWVRDFSNIAFLSTVTVSSENTSTTQLGTKAVDGIVDVFYNPENYLGEWVSNSEGTGAWIKLDWGKPYLIDKIILRDRMNLDDWITGGTLIFSDKTLKIKVGALPNNSAEAVITFPPKRISWVKFVIDSCKGLNSGLAEFEVYPANIAQYASISVSSGIVRNGQTKDKGNLDKWVSTGSVSRPYLKLTWKEPHLVNRVILYDRQDYSERIIKGTMSFSDGSSIPISALSNNETGNTFTFKPRNITWLKFTVDEAIGSNIGLSNIEVFEAL
ncbi:MAG: PIG-L family deacetylase [bacterium]